MASEFELLRELIPGVRSIAEICCGDCSRQHRAYTSELGLQSFHGLDLEPAIIAANREKGIECRQGDALDAKVLRHFVDDDVIFFGPPLSETCDGHRLVEFDQVLPGYGDFARLLFGELHYTGLLVCICPNSTNPGNITQLYHEIRAVRQDVNLNSSTKAAQLSLGTVKLLNCV